MSDLDNSGSDCAAADILVLGGIVVTMDERRTILAARWRFAATRFLRSAPARRSSRPTALRVSSTLQGAW